MFLDSIRKVGDLLAGLTVVTALVILVHGVISLAGDSQITLYDYRWVILGVAALVLLPRSFSISRIFESGWIGVVAAIGAAGYFLRLAILQIRSRPEINQDQTVRWWGAAIALIFIAGCIRDYSRRDQSKLPLFTRRDWLVFFILSIAAIAARSIGPQSAVVDEIGHFNEMHYIKNNGGIPVVGSYCSGYPHLVHHITYQIANYLEPIIDKFQFQKLLSITISGASIGVWFLAVRIFAPFHTALSAGLLLIFLGWHWLNSRFVYLYPHDLGNLALGVLLTFVAFERRYARAAVAAGFIVIYGLIMQKCSALLCIFVGYAALDYLVLSKRGSRKPALEALTILILAGVLAYLPVYLANVTTLNSPRVGLAIAQKDKLGEYGLNSLTVFPFGYKDAFSQLYGVMHDAPRHIFRPTGPILDPILASLLAVGLGLALFRIGKERAARFQLVGLAVFILPMIITFPLDSYGPNGMARRMMGASFFVAWLGAVGADRLAFRLFAERAVKSATIFIASISLIVNLCIIQTSYVNRQPLEWYFDYGGGRAAMLNVARDFAKKGLHVSILDAWTTSIKDGVKDLSLLHFHPDIDSLRQGIESLKGPEWSVVIVPWGRYSQVPPDTAERLSDLVPLNTWQIGPRDPQGLPILRYAFAQGK